MLKLYTDKQVKLIVSNIVKACKDINILSRVAYNYLNLCSGFIAHYNHDGFIAYYSDVDLKNDIAANKESATRVCYREDEADYAYYRQKADMYREICSQLFL